MTLTMKLRIIRRIYDCEINHDTTLFTVNMTMTLTNILNVLRFKYDYDINHDNTRFTLQT